MCVYQPSKTDNLWVYDSNGSWQLSVESADLRVIELAFNQSLKDGYSASEFKVLAQEPVKARPARYQGRRIISSGSHLRFDPLATSAESKD